MAGKAEQSPSVGAPAVRIFISFNVRFITPPEQAARGLPARDGDQSSEPHSGHTPALKSTGIQRRGTVPHFHIPISSVSRGQTGTGALLCQILEGGPRRIPLTAAIPAKAKAAAATERQREARQHAVRRRDAEDRVKTKWGGLYRDDWASIYKAVCANQDAVK